MSVRFPWRERPLRSNCNAVRILIKSHEACGLIGVILDLVPMITAVQKTKALLMRGRCSKSNADNNDK